MPIKREFFEHPSDKFVAMPVPVARLNNKPKARDVSDQINYILNAFISQPKKSSKMPEHTSSMAIKNQMLAYNLLRSRKKQGLNKSLAQGFLKRFTPYGQTSGIQRSKLLPLGLKADQLES